MQWGSSEDWTAAIDGNSLLRKGRQGSQGGEVVLYTKE